VEAGIVTAEDIQRALAEQKKRRGKRLGEVLLEMKLVNELDLARTLARKFHMSFLDMEHFPVRKEAALEVTREFIEKYGVLPIDTDSKTLTVAISDPLSTEWQDVLRFKMKKRILEVVATPTQLKREIAKALRPKDPPPEDLQNVLREMESEVVITEDSERDEPELQATSSGVIKLVNQIIVQGVRQGASDIHFEPNGKSRPVTVRFRVDGECSTYQQIPPMYRNSIVARLKIMAELDISERRKPQDGKIRCSVDGKQVELRVVTLPTSHGGEDVVLRILASAGAMPLEKMNLSARNFIAVRSAVRQPNGLILCVGPTGSGKTTMLHSALAAINTPDRKIWTAEDPVEITQPGMRQVQVNPKIGFTFANALRSFLRADPDVVMIGEMRDQETASIAVEAALTGHMVMSTLHTNSAAETIQRLLDMGLDPFAFSDSLVAVIAQRLVRTLCPDCKTSRDATQDEVRNLAQMLGPQLAAVHGVQEGKTLKLSEAPGCEGCNGSGYKGRVAVHEVLIATPEMRSLIQRRASPAELKECAVAGGMSTLVQDGAEKVIEGMTDLAQVTAACARR